MNIPKEIKIGAHIIEIEEVTPKSISGAGSYRDYYHLIRIENDFDSKESKIAETLLHEIMEVIKLKNNLSIDHTHLTVLSESLFQVLRDNRLDFT